MSIEKENKKVLVLILKAGNNEVKGLFDYSSTAVKNIKVFIPESTYVIIKKDNSFKYIEQHSDIPKKDDDVLLFFVNNYRNIIYKLMNPIPKKFKLNEIHLEYLNNKIWYVLKTIKTDNPDNNNKDCNEEYYLNINDIIKIGKVKYNVNKIHLASQDNKNLNDVEAPNPLMEINYNIYELNKNNSEPVFEFNYFVKETKYSGYIDINEKNSSNQMNTNKKCRICKKENINNETDDGENFLIRLCKCEDLVHYKCLKNYIKENQVNKDIESNIYDENLVFKNFECQNCGKQFPIKFKLENVDKIFYLVDIKELDNCDYMILETLDYKQNDIYIKSIHIIKFLKDIITIGRENDNDVIDNDISISRHHALLKLKDGKICIQNLSKKFGTLVLVKSPIEILDKKIYLQVGRTYIEAYLMEKKELEKIKEQK